MAKRSAAETRATGVAAVAKALIEAADDLGDGSQIAGNLWTLAAAAFDAAASNTKRQTED